MPPTKNQTNRQTYSRSFSNNETSMSARVYHPATNLMPPTPPLSPTGVAPSYGTSRPTTTSWGRQNSTNGKYS
ncbi:uncharacterized protein LOC142981760 [Anticarsia gemmatalis]|uniref:uncharacterized protein LOC142981760 n=1 Tax=Anticarsia gemmatalis TaxID=129554 RepID=UPI003F76C796